MGGDMKYLIIGAAFVLALCVCQSSAADCSTYNTNTTCCAAVESCVFCGTAEGASTDNSTCQNSTIACVGTTTDQCAAVPTSAVPTTADPTTATTANTTTSGDDTSSTVTTPESTTSASTEAVTNDTQTTEGPTTADSSGTTQANQTTEAPTTESPITTPVPTPAHCDPSLQHFDAPSFIGGIILCGAIIAITFFGCKFYKKRSDTKYQQF